MRTCGGTGSRLNIWHLGGELRLHAGWVRASGEALSCSLFAEGGRWGHFFGFAFFTADFRAPFFDHLEKSLQHVDDGAVGTVHAFGESAEAVEVTEELVGAVDEMHDHFGSMFAENRRIRLSEVKPFAR
jgi:hypothetical protein